MKVRADILRTYQSLHTWTGICAGLLLFIGFYAGSLTMFKHQLQQWITPTVSVVGDHNPMPAPLRDWQTLLDTTLQQQAPALQAGFTLDLRESAPVIRWYSQGNARELRLDNQLSEARLNASSQQDTSSQPQQIVLQQHTENRFADLLDYLHRSAGIGGEIGHDQAGVYVLGIAAVLYFLALVSGVVILLPTLTKTFFALRTSKGSSRFWLDSHNLVGIASLPFHLIIAWTVIVFAFHDLIYDGLAPFYGETPMFAQGEPPRQSYDVASLPPLAQQLAAAQAYSPAHQPVHLNYMRLNSRSPMVIIQMLNPDGMVRGPDADYLYMNPYTLEIQPFTFSNQPGADYGKTVMGLFALHYGSYAGDWGRWGYFVMGLFGAFLFYSGNLLWLDKRSQKQQQVSRSTRVMAALTVGVSLGSMLAVVLTLLSGKLLGGNLLGGNLFSTAVSNLNYAYLVSYYSVFVAFMMWTFWQGAARAAYQGLLLLTVSCAALPFASLYLQWRQPDLYAFSSTVGVDLIALLFAAIFAFAAYKTQQRQHKAALHSLWSLPAASVHSAATSSLESPG
jgi:uncharacterized iron-regulated membrane protein